MKDDHLFVEPEFSYEVTRDERVFISYHKKLVVVVAGKQAQKLMAKLVTANADQKQMLLAKITGNFKRGNEKVSQRPGQTI